MRKTICLLAGLTAMLCLLAAPALAAGKTYVMTGQIKAIEAAYNTVVVEVPIGKKLFTVAGPLSDKAVLRKGKAKAKLEDFKPGDTVTVKWTATDKGHLIESLHGK